MIMDCNHKRDHVTTADNAIGHFNMSEIPRVG